MNKFRYIITTLCLVLLSLAAQAAVKIDGIWYELKQDGDPVVYEATVTSYQDGIKYSGEVNIPSSIEYDGISFFVTSIENMAFMDCSGLISVTIPNSVTSIGSSTFNGCVNLTAVTIPDSVTSIEYATFAYCQSLKSVTIPNSVISIGDRAFLACHSLMQVNIPNSVTSIGSNAFSSCGLTSIT